jgi:hypothetical protein
MDARTPRCALRHDTSGEVPPLPSVLRHDALLHPVRAWSSVGAGKYGSCVWESNM